MAESPGLSDRKKKLWRMAPGLVACGSRAFIRSYRLDPAGVPRMGVRHQHMNADPAIPGTALSFKSSETGERFL